MHERWKWRHTSGDAVVVDGSATHFSSITRGGANAPRFHASSENDDIVHTCICELRERRTISKTAWCDTLTTRRFERKKYH
jgi:hypothetical protein